MNRHVERGAEAGQLIAGGRAARIGGDEHDPTALLLKQSRQLAAGRRLARALEAHHHDDRGRHGRELDPRVLAAHQLPQLVPDDLDDLVPRRQALQHVLPHGLDPHALDEVLDDLEVDVRLQQRHPDLFQGLADVLLREHTLPAEPLENGFKLLAEGFEHTIELVLPSRTHEQTPAPRRHERRRFAGALKLSPSTHRRPLRWIA